MDNQKIEQLAELFRQRESVNGQIAQILGGGDELEEKPKKKYKTKAKKNKEPGEGKGGRPRLSEIERENIVRCWQAGDVIRSICKKFNVSPATVSRLVKGLTRESAPETL